MIRGVEHVKLKICHFRKAQYWKLHFFDDYNVIIQQRKVFYTLNLAEWQVLLKDIFYLKIKSFYALYDTRYSQKLQNYLKSDIYDVIDTSNMSDRFQNFSEKSNISR